MAYFELVVAFLVVHSYFVAEDGDFDSAIADELATVAAGVYTAVVVLVAEVALFDSEQLVGFEVVQDVVHLIVADSACYIAH